MKCSRLRCERVAVVNHLCRPHWNASVEGGINGQVSAAAAANHIRLLRELRWSFDGIGKAAGIAGSAARGAFVRQKILRSTERAILAVPLVPFVSASITVPTIGLDRRRQGLAYMGWSLTVVAPMAGTSAQVLCNAMTNGKVSLPLHLRFAAVYDELSGQQGSCRWIATRARTLGFQPPIAWEYADIDDPKAKPFQGFYKESA